MIVKQATRIRRDGRLWIFEAGEEIDDGLARELGLDKPAASSSSSSSAKSTSTTTRRKGAKDG